MTTPHLDDDFGPWVAVLADEYGFNYTSIEDLLEDSDSVNISVVKGTATPTPKDGGIRSPGSHQSDDVLYEVDAFNLDEENAEMLWVRAQRVALALNEHEAKIRKEASQP